ncbi:hypothetical protein OJ997_00005, partial [Solirubrobacter phytolaccae]
MRPATDHEQPRERLCGPRRDDGVRGLDGRGEMLTRRGVAGPRLGEAEQEQQPRGRAVAAGGLR